VCAEQQDGAARPARLGRQEQAGPLQQRAGPPHVHDGTSCHTVYLDELTHTLAVAWLRERQERWPGTTIPYLLVSQQTVVDPSHPPVTPTPNAGPSRPERHSRLREPQNPGRMQRSHTWRRCQAEC
jgi:hypothetical protein